MAPSDLREHRGGPRAAAAPPNAGRTPRHRGRFLPPSLRLRFLRLCDSHQERGVSPLESCCGWVSPWHPVAPPGAAGGACVGLPGLDSPPTLPGVAAPPPRLPHGPAVPGTGTVLASAAVRALAWGAGKKSRPLGSSHCFQPGPGGLWAAVSLAKTPQTPHQRLAGSWATLSPL